MKQEKKFIICFILIALISSSLSVSANLDSLSSELAGKEIPAPLGAIFGDEKINIHFELENGEELILGLVTKDNKFKSLEVGALEDPSLNVYTTESVVKKIENSDNPPAVLKEALESGEITYKAVGLVNKIKFAVLSIVMKFLDGAEEKVVEDTEEIEEEEEESVAEEDNEVEETEDVKEDNEEETEVSKPVVEETTGPKTHIVKLIDGGFEDASITVKVGDTVEWHNVRNGNTKKAMIIGTQQCIKVKSEIFELGEHYAWTFDKAETCTFVDGIFTTAVMKVIVEE